MKTDIDRAWQKQQKEPHLAMRPFGFVLG